MIYEIYDDRSKRGRDETSFLNRISTYAAAPAKRARRADVDTSSFVGCVSAASVSIIGSMVNTPYGPGRVTGDRGVRMGHRVYQVEMVDRNGCSTGCAVVYLKENDMQVI
eukprot:CAMPEP_0197464026 /NCGR_PEP_ID=MMETSP1175-20131217/63385_1 /TAXON_ID=1003142 /ORGANISM="Triceratium dubium, Strain CCMP147" /LENGTH=109 /DNA_ID=CAMNT_0042999927 /DNA_START=128 /DNA_END=457 /DNA_ORIENTATION=-